MKFCDMHNDAVTSKKDWGKYAEINDKKGNITVYALFYDGKNEKEIYAALPSLKNRFYSFENIGYKNPDDIKNLVFSNKPLYASLTWNDENYLAFGCNNNDEDIKKEGLKVISLLNEANIILDAAHLSRKAFFSVIEKADRVINSHTCFQSVQNHKRNITDEQVKAIIQKDGIIGLCLYSYFVCGKKEGTIEDIVRHIDYFIQKFPYENLAIGSDFFGAEDFAGNIKDYESLYKIVEKLQKLGYNDKVIKGIFYDNFLNFINREY